MRQFIIWQHFFRKLHENEIITARKRSFRRLLFSHLSVILFTGGLVCVCIPACNGSKPPRKKPGRPPPGGQTPRKKPGRPLQEETRKTPQEDRPPRKKLGRSPSQEDRSPPPSPLDPPLLYFTFSFIESVKLWWAIPSKTLFSSFWNAQQQVFPGLFALSLPKKKEKKSMIW